MKWQQHFQRIFALAACAAGLLAPPAPGFAASSEAIDCVAKPEALRALVAARHEAPTRVQIDALCTDPHAALVALIEAPGVTVYTQARAISLLPLWPAESDLTMLAKMSTAEKQLGLLRRAALRALDRTERARPNPELMRDVLNKTLGASSAHLRRTAARCLRNRPRLRARARQALTEEKDPRVLATIKAALDPVKDTVKDKDKDTVK